MTPGQRALRDYWIEIGKVKAVPRVPDDPASRKRYFFIRNDGIELEMFDSWKQFFETFDTLNEVAVHYEEDPWFDPWETPELIELKLNFSQILPYGNDLTFRGVIKLK